MISKHKFFYWESGDVEYWVRDYTWYLRIPLWIAFGIIGWMGVRRATKKEMCMGVLYAVIAFKDSLDFIANGNRGTVLVDYTILFVTLFLVHLYFKKYPEI